MLWSHVPLLQFVFPLSTKVLFCIAKLSKDRNEIKTRHVIMVKICYKWINRLVFFIFQFFPSWIFFRFCAHNFRDHIKEWNYSTRSALFSIIVFVCDTIRIKDLFMILSFSFFFFKYVTSFSTAQTSLLGYWTYSKLECNSCDKSYSSLGNLRRHQKYECNVAPKFFCSYCNAKFKHNFKLKRHKMRCGYRWNIRLVIKKLCFYIVVSTVIFN